MLGEEDGFRRFIVVERVVTFRRSKDPRDFRSNWVKSMDTNWVGLSGFDFVL